MQKPSLILICLAVAPFVLGKSEAGQPPTETPRTRNYALIRAVQAGDAPYVRQLLREGADPNARLTWQRATNIDEFESATVSALYLALGWKPQNIGCYNAVVGSSHELIDGREDLVAALLRAGANPNATGDQRFTPLSFAVQHNSLAIVKQLISFGAKVGPEPNGLSLLHSAAANFRHEAADLLLRLGADPNSRDERGLTPLAWAVVPTLWAQGRRDEQVRFVRLLLKYGADPAVYDKQNWTPVDAALDGDAEVLRLLLFAGSSARRDKSGR